MRDTRCLTDKIKPMPGDDTLREAKDNVAQLTAKLESDKGQVDAEFEPLGAEFPATRQGFAGLYQSLIAAGQKPESNDALSPPEHPNVDLMPNGDVFGSYKDLGAYLKSQQLSMSRKESKESGVMGFEKHHLIEDHWLKPFGFSQGKAPCVAVYADEHMQLAHGEEGIATELPRVAKLENGETVPGVLYDIEDLVEGHSKVYQELGRPEWAERLKDYVRDNHERIIQAYENGTVPWATKEDTARARKYLRSFA